MPVPYMAKVGGQWGIASFTDGFSPSPIYNQSLTVEARRNPEAVLMRLMNIGAWDLAEEMWGRFIETEST